MSQKCQSYSHTVTRFDLELVRPELQRFSICQSQAHVTHLERIAGHESKRLWLILLVALLIGSVCLIPEMAAAERADKPLYAALIVAAAVMGVVIIVRLVWGVNLIGAMMRSSVLYPLIRWNVNRLVNRTLKRAPFSATYDFSDSSYSVRVPELGLERIIGANEVTVAYYAEPVFCLFKNNKQMWKAIIYATSNEHCEVVREFLRRNDIEVREPILDLLAEEPRATEQGK